MKKILTTLFVLLAMLSKAQDRCDSLDVKVSYYPFTDTLIYVEVINNGQYFFNYPQFFAFDSNNDTVATETLNLFGISQSSAHQLDVHPGMPVSDSFSGSLELYYMTVDSYAVCTWNNFLFDLCPDTCVEFYPYLANYGSAYVFGAANWQILNSSQQVIASGSFALDSLVQQDQDTVCLNPGQYTLRCTNVNLSQGGQKVIGMTKNYLPGPQPEMQFNGSLANLPFELYGACSLPTSLNERKAQNAGMQIYAADGKIFIRSEKGAAIGETVICSIDGKIVSEKHIDAASYSADMSGFAAGIYIVRIINGSGSFTAKVVCGR